MQLLRLSHHCVRLYLLSQAAGVNFSLLSCMFKNTNLSVMFTELPLATAMVVMMMIDDGDDDNVMSVGH